jgi:hypothetical protein
MTKALDALAASIASLHAACDEAQASSAAILAGARLGASAPAPSDRRPPPAGWEDLENVR